MKTPKGLEDHKQGEIIMNKCCDPNAEIKKCAVCGNAVHTCENTVPINNDYTCPVHPDGIEHSNGLWFCNNVCYEAYV